MASSASFDVASGAWVTLLHKRVMVVGRDGNGLVAVNKPSGVISHPNTSFAKRNALLLSPYDPRRRTYAAFGGEVFLLNRLDEPTEGLVLLTQSDRVAGAVRESFKQYAVRKTYYAFSKCGPMPSRLWHDFAAERNDGKSVRLYPGKGTEMRTEVKIAKKIQLGELSCFLLELHPLTGRTHQLRFQCARRGIPIAGDRIYGDFAYNKAFYSATGSHRLQLLAAEIEFEYTLDRKVFHFFAQSPSADAFLALPGCGKQADGLT